MLQSFQRVRGGIIILTPKFHISCGFLKGQAQHPQSRQTGRRQPMPLPWDPGVVLVQQLWVEAVQGQDLGTCS